MHNVKHDKWLSNLLNKKAYNLKDISLVDSLENFPKNIFIDVKIDSNKLSEISKANKLGFKLIDIGLCFLKLQSSIKDCNLSSKFNIRLANIEDEECVRELASNSFLESRFYKDNNIDNLIASKIKEEWAGNFFKNKRGDFLIIATKNSKIVGFLLLQKSMFNELIIDLIAVDKDCRGNGCASDMINFAFIHFLKDISRVKVGTQLSNIGAINLYTKLCFKLSSSNYIFHTHR